MPEKVLGAGSGGIEVYDTEDDVPSEEDREEGDIFYVKSKEQLYIDTPGQ